MIWLECRDAALAREGRVLVSGLDFAVESGQLLCITGPNGAGKSTLLAGLLGTLPPVSGTICRDAGLTGIGYVPQRDQARRDLPASVWEVVCSGRLSGRRPHLFASAADKAAVRARLEELDLLPLARRAFGALSGGQQRRVLLARALCAADQLLILDEPLNGLDAASAARLWAVLARYCAAGGAAVVVSHDLAGAGPDSRLLVLENGRQAYYGPRTAWKEGNA